MKYNIFDFEEIRTERQIYLPIQCLRTPGSQGQGQIDFMPIVTLLRSTTYSILKKIGQKGIFPLLWNGVLYFNLIIMPTKGTVGNCRVECGPGTVGNGKMVFGNGRER